MREGSLMHISVPSSVDYLSTAVPWSCFLSGKQYNARSVSTELTGLTFT